MATAALGLRAIDLRPHRLGRRASRTRTGRVPDRRGQRRAMAVAVGARLRVAIPRRAVAHPSERQLGGEGGVDVPGVADLLGDLVARAALDALVPGAGTQVLRVRADADRSRVGATAGVCGRRDLTSGAMTRTGACRRALGLRRIHGFRIGHTEIACSEHEPEDDCDPPHEARGQQARCHPRSRELTPLQGRRGSHVHVPDS